MTFKQKVYMYCLDILNNKIRELQNTLQDLSASAASDTKSSAGDKHETARAMIQIEQENIRKQLDLILEQKAFLEKIVPDLYEKAMAAVRPGGLVKTNKGYLFVSVALGKIVVDGKTITAISPKSPLGSKLLGLRVNDTAEINSASYIIQEVD